MAPVPLAPRLPRPLAPEASDGRFVWLPPCPHPLQGADIAFMPDGSGVLFVDVHHRKTRQRRSRLFTGQASCVLDGEGHFLNVSPSLAAFFHCDGAELRGRSLLTCLDAGEAEQMASVLAAARGGQTAAFEVRLRDPGGAPTWVAMQLAPGGVDPGGEPLLVACFMPPA